MATVKWCGPMEAPTMVSGIKIRCAAKGSSAGPMVINAKANGKMTSRKAKQNSHGLMAIAMLETGKKADVMETVSSSLTMAAYSTVASGLETFNKGKASSTGPPTTATKVHS